MKKYKYQELRTSDSQLDTIPLSEYPRPQFKRDSYLSLNGEWEFTHNKKEELPLSYDKKIIVPYCVESSLSNIKEIYDSNEILFYKKEFVLPNGFNKGRIILHFDGVDCYARIFINKKEVFYHEGGYIPFEMDISPYIEEKNIIEVCVKDPLDGIECYGKQKDNRGGMWYTKVSGIWKSVWLESTSLTFVQDVRINTTLDSVSLKINSNAKQKKVTIYLDNNKKIIKELSKNEITISIPNPINWTPENPHLYYFDIEVEGDKVTSYFALRTLEIKKHNGYNIFHLNNKPYFFHGLLDQGYYPDGIYTPFSYYEYERDITRMKELGFNTLRKHIKIEPLYFYYLCDKIGMVVFQDMVNNSPYYFYRDTLRPTIISKKMNDKKFKVPSKNKEVFIRTMKETINLLYNSPCICLWTIFNESWGQFESKRINDILLTLDTSRFIDATSGWYDNGNSLNSKHIYFFKKFKIKYDGRPSYLSEFGGYEYSIKEHRYNLDKVFGYRHFKSSEDLQKGITELYKDNIIPLKDKGLSASIYTQVSDVEDETNGLLTYDRKVIKVNKEEMNKIAKKLTY